MQVDFSKFVKENQTIAIATSGGSDSMALLHYTLSQAKKYHFKVIALNIEHGIRGQASISDTEFVKKFCTDHDIPVICYSVDSIKFAKEQKLSIEQAARILRYQCFDDAINSNKCNKVATAHHAKDNAESVLFNLFRGTGIKGVVGITDNYSDKIIRPFLHVSKAEINEYITQNAIPYVTDQTNFSDDYTRNFIRHNVLPEIEKIFPSAEKSISRFTEIAKLENAYMEEQARKAITLSNNFAQITLPIHPALLSRALIIALKHLGVEKDWEKIHVDNVIELANAKNGKKINLPKNVIAIKEYDKLCLFLHSNCEKIEIPFGIGKFDFFEHKIFIKQISSPVDVKNGFYCDFDKIPETAVIRQKKDGDIFTKFGGGTKSLNDYLTDKKIPQRLRPTLPVLAVDNIILAIFGVAVSDKIKVDGNTKRIIKLTKEENYGNNERQLENSFNS